MLFIPTLSKNQFESFIALRYGDNINVLPPDDAVAFGTRYFGLRYVGLQDNSGDISAAMLLFEYKPPGFPPFFYGCKGHISAHDKEFLISEFTKALKVFAREHKAMFIFQVSEAEAVVAPIIANHIGWFLYKKVLPLLRWLSSKAKHLSKSSHSNAAIAMSCSISEMPD